MAKIVKRPIYQVVDGILVPKAFYPKHFKEALNYKPQNDDVFIVTYPKCGTTWMQNVALYIFRKGKELDDPQDFKKLCPFIDPGGIESIALMPKPGAFKTHLPYNRMPYSPKAKYIFVARNPKDCCVSFYHHAKLSLFCSFWDGEFQDFFEAFMLGEVEYNDYFDHLLSWYPHRNDPNVFYTTYEEMKRDLESIVIKLAIFLGKEHIETIEKDNAVLRNILQFSSFDYMKKNLSQLFSGIQSPEQDKDLTEAKMYLKNVKASINPPKEMPKKEFIRKGIVGDWKNYFTSEQHERLNNKFFEKTKDTEIPKWFKME